MGLSWVRASGLPYVASGLQVMVLGFRVIWSRVLRLFKILMSFVKIG